MDKFIKETLECKLTDEELQARGKQLAHASSKINQLKDAGKTIQADFKAKVAAEEATMGVLSTEISRGTTYREVDCIVHYNNPKHGEKTIFRSDTSEIVRMDIMSKFEMESLFIESNREDAENKEDNVVDVEDCIVDEVQDEEKGGE